MGVNEWAIMRVTLTNQEATLESITMSLRNKGGSKLWVELVGRKSFFYLEWGVKSWKPQSPKSKKLTNWDMA